MTQDQLQRGIDLANYITELKRNTMSDFFDMATQLSERSSQVPKDIRDDLFKLYSERMAALAAAAEEKFAKL